MEYESHGQIKNFRLGSSFHEKIPPQEEFFGNQFSSDRCKSLVKMNIFLTARHQVPSINV